MSQQPNSPSPSVTAGPPPVGTHAQLGYWRRLAAELTTALEGATQELKARRGQVALLDRQVRDQADEIRRLEEELEGALGPGAGDVRR